MNDSIEGIEPYEYVPELVDIRVHAHDIGRIVFSKLAITLDEALAKQTEFADSLELQVTEDERDLLRLPPPIRDSQRQPGSRILYFNMPTFEQLRDDFAHYKVTDGEIAELYAGSGIAARMLEEQIDTDDPEQVQIIAERLSDKTRFTQAIFNASAFSLEERVDLLDSLQEINADDVARINVLRFAMGTIFCVANSDNGYAEEVLSPEFAIDIRMQELFAQGLRTTFKTKDYRERLLRALGKDEDLIKQHCAELFSHIELAACFPMESDEIDYILKACRPSADQ